ncbi:MAG: hypothetical protein WC629_02370 [Candidatus Paceibacterota bacterium]|jgi:hypothetical protein
MYQSLIKIGLEKYLKEYFFEKEWLFERYLENLDIFVSSKDCSQKDILKNKFKENLSHLSLNDHLNEVMVACAFYPKGLFQKESKGVKSSDIVDCGVEIEIKTINADSNEIERIKVLKPNSMRDNLPKDLGYELRICEKFKQRIEKAKKQIKNNGVVYIVWDSTLVVDWENRKNMIEILFKKLIELEESIYPDLTIKTIFFGDLREIIASQKRN